MTILTYTRTMLPSPRPPFGPILAFMQSTMTNPCVARSSRRIDFDKRLPTNVYSAPPTLPYKTLDVFCSTWTFLCNCLYETPWNTASKRQILHLILNFIVGRFPLAKAYCFFVRWFLRGRSFLFRFFFCCFLAFFVFHLPPLDLSNIYFIYIYYFPPPVLSIQYFYINL